MKLLIALIAGLLMPFQALAQSHTVVWSEFETMSGFGAYNFGLEGNRFPEWVTLLSFEVTAPEDGLIFDRGNFSFEMNEGQTTTFNVNVTGTGYWYNSFYFQRAGLPGIYVRDVRIRNLVFEVSDASIRVPEPAAWGMMIGGFALTGAAMRTRRRRAAFA